VPHLSADDPGEVDAARHALLALGPAATDVLLHTLRFGRFRARQAVLAVLGELPIDPAVLHGLVERELDRIRQILLLHEALRRGGAADVALQRLRERVDEGTYTAVLLLAAIHDDERLAKAGRLLLRVHTRRDRALVLEALEALLPPADRGRLLPLLEDTGFAALARTAGAALERPLPSFDQAVTEAMASNDALTRDLLLGTLPSDVLARRAAVDPGRGFVPYQSPGDVVSNVDSMLHLRSLDLFAGLTTRQLAELARVVDDRMVQSGVTIVREGEYDDQMYFIVAGTVRISKGGETVTTLGPREFFGEIAVFDGEQRSATATADGPVRLLRLARQDLFDVMEEHPGIAVAICQTLSRRVRSMLSERGDAPAARPRADGDA